MAFMKPKNYLIFDGTPPKNTKRDVYEVIRLDSFMTMSLIMTIFMINFFKYDVNRGMVNKYRYFVDYVNFRPCFIIVITNVLLFVSLSTIGIGIMIRISNSCN